MANRIMTPTSYDEWRPFDQVVSASFGAAWEEPKAEEIESYAREAPFDFRIGVMDGDEVLGACAAYEFDLSLPGGCAVSVAALTGVGGDPTKRGRGALRAMIVEHLDRARARGHAASILNASESSIYGQFGYGHATTTVGYEVDPDRAEFRQPLEDPGSFELVHDLEASIPLFQTAYDAAARTVPGTGGRNVDWWKSVVGKKSGWRGGGKQLGVVHRDVAGVADGYLLYELKETGGWVNNDAVIVRELLGASVTTELALFEFATKIPLQRNVRWPEGPVDFVARHHLFDPRQLHVVDSHDLLWLRPLNIVELLASRTYAADGTFVLGIDDDLHEDQRGPWRLEIVDGIAEVVPTDEPAAVTLTSQQVGMLLLGDHRLQELVYAGVVTGDPAVLRSLDQALLTDRRPYNLSKF
jgi:predicted acetyltransferase